MNTFFELLISRAATLGELLSDEFEAHPGQKGDADPAARRLAAWCRACASGDWSLFERRLQRDGQSIAESLPRLATVRRKAAAATPPWIEDAIWIEAALRRSADDTSDHFGGEGAEPCAFQDLLVALVADAERKVWHSLDERAVAQLTPSGHAALRRLLLQELSRLCAPALYESLAKARAARGATNERARQSAGAAVTSLYREFVDEMRSAGWRPLFERKPVLLRLIATITRQWIETSCELLMRLDADLAAMRSELIGATAPARVTDIEGELSDPHNGGHSVLILRFDDGTRAVYKPKDLRLDAAWHALVQKLNDGRAPVELKAVRALVRDGYGWTEFIEHKGCADAEGCRLFFRRAGAWLALFHAFAGSDMHQENMIATAAHPVPIDLEMILQATAEEQKLGDVEAQAFEAAVEIVDSSVLTVGLLPAYGRSPENKIFAVGGMTSDWTSRMEISWTGINSDAMRPAKTKKADTSNPNLPHVEGRYAKLGDHLDDFVAGYEDYAKFLLALKRRSGVEFLLQGFAGLPVRKVIRPTRFYYLLLQRLRDHRSMDDGATWSAQADFLARLSNWDEPDPVWPLQRAERAALLALNVPHFVSPSDGNVIRDAFGAAAATHAAPGLSRAHARLQNLDETEIAWQVEVIRQNTAATAGLAATRSEAVGAPPRLPSEPQAAPSREIFLAEADVIAADLSRSAIRKGPSAAWIGLDWLGDSTVSQLVCLGPTLYNGLSGIAVFLAAHAAVTASDASAELALAALAHLRKSLRSRNAARVARSLGTGGATGLGSVVYALALTARSLRSEALLSDAHAAAALFSDDLIAADRQLDVLGGNAGGILGLVRLYRDSGSHDALERAMRCGEQLLAQSRSGPEGRRSWVGQGLGARPLSGMSHGAAGFAYALASLAQASGRDDFADAAAECLACENTTFDAEKSNWPDLREDGGSGWICQWCHGAPGIGLARAAMLRRGGERFGRALLLDDLRGASVGAERGWPGHVDTMCCGTLGSIELFCEAPALLQGNGREGGDRPPAGIGDLASRRLMAVIEAARRNGDYLWNAGSRRFNPGLFRGLAGVGYSILRRVDPSLPNVLIWE
jgi:type 2 lantibiotic biosynthesis protein LanM